MTDMVSATASYQVYCPGHHWVLAYRHMKHDGVDIRVPVRTCNKCGYSEHMHWPDDCWEYRDDDD